MNARLARADVILKMIVEQYLADGQPVSSKFIAAQEGLDVSPATVRNTMVQLEQSGLIRSPHTSAGRIPTTQGIREFFNRMLQLQPLPMRWLQQVQKQLPLELPVSLLCQRAGQLLTNLTGCVAIISPPKAGERIIRQVDLVRLAADSLLLVVIDEDGDILHRVLHHKSQVDNATLSQGLCLLNAALSGVQWQEGMSRLEIMAQREQGALQQLVSRVLGQLGLDEMQQHQPLIYGQHQLLLSPEYQRNPALQQVFSMLENPAGLVRFLQTLSCDDHVKLVLGKETGFAELASVSLIVQRYQQSPHRFIALLGPRRMPYGQFVPLIEACSRQLNLNLNP
ncbi:heat-inducible transcriptional repressor HrcA [Alkalimonas sp. MEB108]|uniref:Heat-inducible transcription repressor HrcA n=1 Tax=Alkalimonas cellulosilytica TaxID=3058395 RepID=A0ABU7J177_9GAMM|nr:heat-inducible transcriptional repressor HrcA [Alkalimonas sp. MEB108]MEE2000192.1 heat-inducible transcriptional repressor HrcA [Alkalimonas sp. MEB108]